MKSSLNILVVEDDPADFWLLDRLIKQQGLSATCSRVDRLDDLERKLTAEPWDVVLTDYTVPHLAFEDVLALLQARIPDVPIIVVSGTIGEEKAVALMKEGVADFILKDAPLRLATAIERSVREADDRKNRRNAEATLALLEAAINSATHIVVITDKRGCLTWVNPAFTNVTGYGFDEAIGRTPGQLVKSGLHDAAFYKEMWATLHDGRTWRGEMTNRRKNGDLYPEQQIITPVRNACGEVTHYVGIKRDMTDEKQLQAQLARAQKMETIARLSAGIAHDFNNLITAINGAAELALLKAEPGDAVHRDLLHIRKTAGRAASLTRQLLAFGRPAPLGAEPVSLTEIVHGLMDMILRLLGEDIALTVVAPDPEAFVRADRGQMEQVLMNLVVNARDAMPQGGSLRLEVGVRDSVNGRREGESSVVLSVSDTGTGMSQETLAKIFEPFFTTKEPGRGTGLGLPMVQSIVHQANGTVEVDSEPGVGTCFTMVFPWSPGRTTAPLAADAERPDRVEGNETILLVEDEDILRDVAQRMLERAGFAVVAVDTGEAALEQLADARQTVDLLLTDVLLPGINGGELTSHLAGMAAPPRVLYTSGYSRDIVGTRAELVAGAQFLPKPYTMASLVRTVREVLDGPAVH